MGTDIGSNWTEEVGDWYLDAGRLKEDGTANARAITTVEVPADSAGEMDVFVQVLDYHVGDIFRLYVAYSSSSEYWYLQATYAGGDYWNIVIYHNSTPLASTTQLATVNSPGTPDEYITMRACIDSDGNFKAGVISTADEPAWVSNAGNPVGRKAGVGHNNTTYGAEFDNFLMRELRTDDLVCSQCWCTCNGNVPSKTLQVTVITATDRASCLLGRTAQLTYVWSASLFSWVGTIVWTGTNPCTLPILLKCDSTVDWNCPGVNWTIELINGACCTTGCTTNPDCDTSECWPLQLRFGPFQMLDSDLACTCCFQPDDPSLVCPPDLEPEGGYDSDCAGYFTLEVIDIYE